jgi:hypothetical protein
MIALLTSASVIFALAYQAAGRVLPRHRPVFWSGLLLRLLGGVAVGLVYHYHYGLGDTLLFFDQGVTLAQQASENPAAYLACLWSGAVAAGDGIVFEPRTAFFIKLVSVVSLFTFSNYWAASLWFSLAAFLCAWRLTKNISMLLPEGRVAAYVAFLFFPSVVFWGSGIIKEAMALAGLCYLSGTVLKIHGRQKVHGEEWLLSLVSFWMLWNLKYYWCTVFVAVAASWLLVQRLADGYRWPVGRSVGVWALVLAGLVTGSSFMHPNFYPHRLFAVIVENYQAFQSAGGPSVVVYPHLQPNFWGMFSSAPLALATGLFRPFVTDVHHWFSAFAALENLALLALLVTVPYRSAWNTHQRWRLMVMALAAYIFILATFLALSTPNLGTLVRYRVGFLPFFVLLLAVGNPWLRRLNQRWAR